MASYVLEKEYLKVLLFPFTLFIYVLFICLCVYIRICTIVCPWGVGEMLNLHMSLQAMIYMQRSEDKFGSSLLQAPGYQLQSLGLTADILPAKPSPRPLTEA